MTTSSENVRQQAANDNPGGATAVEMSLSAFVTVMAKAYVAEDRTSERSA